MAKTRFIQWDDVRFVLDENAPLWHIILIPSLQSLLLLLNAAYLAEKQQIPVL